jgi:hypothetical protein
MAKKVIKKGEVLNPKGRPKGAVGKITKQVKDSLQFVMERLESTIVEDIQKVTPQRRLQLYTDLMQFVKPKLASTKADVDVKTDSKIEFVIRYDNQLPPAKNDVIDI